MYPNNFTIARKPVPMNKRIAAARIDKIGDALNDVRKVAQTAHYYESVFGREFDTSKMVQSVVKYREAVKSASDAVALLPYNPTLGTHIKSIGTRLGLGARSVGKLALGVVGTAALFAAYGATLGTLAGSKRVGANAKFVLLHGCLDGARTDFARMFCSDSEGLKKKYIHIGMSAYHKGYLNGALAPVFDGVRSPG